ncbi:hypothetical protein ACHAWF_013870 [Thalassiosira exigua]
MDALLESCDAADLGPTFLDLGVSTVEEVSVCEVADLVADLGIDEAKARTIVDKARDAHLFEKRKDAVTRTWKAVEESLSVEATKLFYKRLFEQHPAVVPMFGKADMDSQAEKLFKTVGVAVDYLKDVEGLISILEDLGARHANEWKVEREHYDAVGECLIWTLKTGLGDAWTDEVADAWTWVYGVIGKTMADAGDKAHFERRKAVVTKTWKAVEDSLSVEATKLFYKRLFEQYPSVIPLFSHADMDSQAEKLFKTVGLAVSYLDDIEGLIPVLEDLGARHAKEWSCEWEHYAAVGECLLWTLETGLGEAWTDEVKDAWTWVYGVIATTMADAGEKVLEEKKECQA